MNFERRVEGPGPEPRLIDTLAERLAKRPDRINFYEDLEAITAGDELAQPELLAELIEDYVKNPLNRIAMDYLPRINSFLDSCGLNAVSDSRLEQILARIDKVAFSAPDPETRDTLSKIAEGMRERHGSA